MSDLKPIFIGFLAKKIVSRPNWLKCSAVQEVCSVSECISAGPPDRIDSWVHNDVGFYDTEDLALTVVPEQEREEYDLFAYRIWPLRFHEELAEEEWNPVEKWAELPEEPELSRYGRIGYDLVGNDLSDFFECSPLSCNGVAGEIEVNQFCLIDDHDDAIEVGRRFGRSDSGVEPADYYLVEVWRKRS